MSFSNPMALLLGLLAIPILALYARPARPRRYRVATGFLWRQAASTSRGRSAWRRWRRPASLCLALAVLGLLVLAAADPHVPAPRTLVVVIDNSASMNATDVEPSRLGAAKRQAEGLIAGLGYGDRLALVSAGGPVRVLCPATGRHPALRAALQAVPATRGATNVEEAVALGRSMLAGSPGGRVIVLSDGGFAGAAGLGTAEDVDLVRIGVRSNNLAIARLATRRSLADPRRCQVLAQVKSFCEEPVRCHLDLELDGKPLESVPVELAAAGQWQRVFELTTAEPGRLLARLDRRDDLADDNQAAASVGPAPVRRVTLVAAGSPYLEKALRSLASVEVTVSAEAPEASEPGRIIVFDRQVPTMFPEGPVLVVDPAGPCDLWRLGDALEGPEIARQDDASPLLADVRLAGVRLGDARRLVLTDAAKAIAEPLAWTAEGDPVAWAIDRPGGRVLVLLGSLETGELGRRAGFRVLMGNALDWLCGGAERPKGSGVFFGHRASHTENPLTEKDSRPLPLAESDLRLPTLQEPEGGLPGPAPRRPPPWMLLAAAAVVLLAMEWGLYQRRWVG